MSNEHIDDFRQFNRFHTRLVGALNEHLLASDYTLPQVRIMYELSNAPRSQPPSARDLSKKLSMDTGYLSRLINGLVKEGLIEKVPSQNNTKRLELALSEKGKEVFAGLNKASAEEAGALLESLSPTEQRELIGAMARIRCLLGDISKDSPFILRDPEPGDLGWITHQHGRLYAKEYGWDWTFEALVAKIVGQFAEDFDPSGEKCWVAERNGEIIGSVFVVREGEDTAKLRLLYVDASARGLGLGRKLVDEAVRFARAKGYKRMILWTNDVLVSARRIYEATGFELLEEEPHHSFGKDLVGQIWGRDL